MVACCAVRIRVSCVNLPACVCAPKNSMSPPREAGTALSKALLYNVIINVLPVEKSVLLILGRKMYVAVEFAV